MFEVFILEELAAKILLRVVINSPYPFCEQGLIKNFGINNAETPKNLRLFSLYSLCISFLPYL